MDLEGPLMSDMFQQDRLLINGVETKINLTQSRDAFCIMAKSCGWKVHLLDAYIKICKLTPIPAIILAHDAALELKPASYPFNRTEMKAYQMNAGQFDFNFEDIYQGTVPTQVICAMVDATALNGSFIHNPYISSLQHQYYSSICG